MIIVDLRILNQTSNMEHQDLEIITWNKKTKTGGPKIINPPGTKTFRELDGSSPPPPDTVNRSLCIQIQQARVAKNWKQKDLAMRLRVLPVDIAKIENGFLAPTKKQIRDIQTITGVKLL